MDDLTPYEKQLIPSQHRDLDDTLMYLIVDGIVVDMLIPELEYFLQNADELQELMIKFFKFANFKKGVWLLGIDDTIETVIAIPLQINDEEVIKFTPEI